VKHGWAEGVRTRWHRRHCVGEVLMRQSPRHAQPRRFQAKLNVSSDYFRCMESNRRRSGPEGSAGCLQGMSGRLEGVTVGAASCRGFASRRAVCTLPILGPGSDTRKSLEVSSYSLSDSGISLQIRPKASEKTRRRQNLPRNRIGNELPFLANPTLQLRRDLRKQYSAQFSPSIGT
jgi:hypothetical protein